MNTVRGIGMEARLTQSKAGTVLVYRGEGAGWRSVKSTCESVERLLLTGPLRRFVKRVKVDTLSTRDLLDGSWTQQAALLVMPGGADLPYCKHLNGRGNRIIKEFVLSGGAYLGLCAGAYYGCARVVFEPGTPLEVVGDRELAFFPGVARGAAFPGFDYLTEAGAVAAQVDFCVPAELATAPHQPAQWPPAAAPPLQTAAAAAAAGSPLPFVGGPQEHHSTTYDYCNGGPYFTALDGGVDVDQIPGVTLLASYCHVPTAAAAAATDQQPGAGQAGPAQEPSGNGQRQQQRVRQEGFVRCAAAVRCAVGQGVAVLCGTHPELGPHWLDPCGESNAAQGPQPHTQQQQTYKQAAAVTTGSDTAPPSQQMQETRTVLGGRQVMLAQEPAWGSRADPDPAAAAAAGAQQLGDSSSPEQVMPVVCRDIALAAHAQHLRRELQAWQGERDLLLSSLLYAALVRG